MSAGPTQVSTETIEKTKQQIRGLVGEIAQYSKSDMEPEEFYAAFLQKVVQALAAVGGAVWILGEGRKPQLAYQINLSGKLLDKESEEADKHYRLLDYIIASKDGKLIPPLSGAGDERLGGNPTRQLLVIHPMGHDEQVEGLVEIFQRPDTQPATQKGYLQFLKQMCELSSEWFKNRKLRQFTDRHSLWAQADQFSRQVHESLEVRETCYTIVNEGRRMLGCDRVSIAIVKGGKCVIEAVSGQDTLDTRSNVVTLLGNVATRVVKSGEPLWYAGSTEDLPPQIEQALEEYVDQSYTKSMAVIPLRKPKPTETGNTPTVAEEERSHQGQIVGALIIEQIESDIPREILAPRLDLVYEHSARAISNSLDHNSLFLMPVWRALGQSKWVVRGRALPKTVSITAAVVALILALALVPWDFDMRAKGTLEPVHKRDVFANTSGQVVEVLKTSGQTVVEGEPLVRLRNDDLAIKIKEVEGQRDTTLQEIAALQARIGDRTLSPQDLGTTHAQLNKAKSQLQSLLQQLDLLMQRAEQLVVKAPISGRIITWDFKRLLQDRPVETGQVLLTVAADDSAYELELFMPERRVKHVIVAREKLKREQPDQDLKVEYFLMTDPGTRHHGTVIDVNAAAETHEEHGNVVRVRVRPDESPTNPHPGAAVTADVHCGRSSVGWAFFHEAWEYLQGALFF